MSETPSLRQAALDYHAFPKPGKLEVRATKPLANPARPRAIPRAAIWWRW